MLGRDNRILYTLLVGLNDEKDRSIPKEVALPVIDKVREEVANRFGLTKLLDTVGHTPQYGQEAGVMLVVLVPAEEEEAADLFLGDHAESIVSQLRQSAVWVTKHHVELLVATTTSSPEVPRDPPRTCPPQ